MEWGVIRREGVGGEGVEVVGEVGSCIRWDEFMIL